MKKLLVLLLIVVMSIGLVACGESDSSESTSSTYTIQYYDGSQTSSITVQDGQSFVIETIPTKEGYVFDGYYDAEVGGVKYTNANGISLSAYMDKKDLSLFPHFVAKQYTITLDYQGAAVTGVRELTVEYDGKITTLPMGLIMTDKEFMGWYTEPNRGGTQIADQYGVLSRVNVLNSTNFNLGDDGYITLYAGFRGEMHNVTFYFAEGIEPEEVQIEHGTLISSYVSETKVADKAVITWSKTQNDTALANVFSGKVTEDMVLYACEYAPYITFNANGGKDVNEIVARAGATITLPNATRDNYTFAGWYTAGGVQYTATTMPSESVSLTAKWNPIIVFDTRGGTSVNNITAAVGTTITLPTTEKSDYIFAGWYTEQGEAYTTSSMPENSIKLSAKWYAVQHEKIVIVTADDEMSNSNTKPTINSKMSDNYVRKVDLSEIYNAGVRNVTMTAHFEGKHTAALKGYMAWYSTNTASDAYKVWGYSYDQLTTYQAYTFTTDLVLTTSTYYVCPYSTNNNYNTYVRDFWVDIEYPDMSKLY